MLNESRTEQPTRRMDRRAVWSWCGFDWANSPFPAVVLTFVIPAYFTQAVMDDPARAASLWAVMTGIAALTIALLSPILGRSPIRGEPANHGLGFSPSSWRRDLCRSGS